MKQRLAADARFYEPYIIHDEVTVYDKNNNCYITRRRSVGISFSEDGNILIAHAICSEKDTFDKKKGATIVRSRINTTLKSSFAKMKNVFYFNSLETFNSFTTQFDASSRLFFVPFEVALTNESGVTKSIRTLAGKSRTCDSKSPSEAYFNKKYINEIYAKFFSVSESLVGSGNNSQDLD